MKSSRFLRHHFIIPQRSPFQIPSRSLLELAYNEYGKNESGIPVIISHGLLGSKKNWASLSERISSQLHRRVITVDNRNHGESPHASSHTYHELAADTSMLIDKLGSKQADVIGHSMGGRTCMALALMQPAKVHSMIIVDISPVSTAGILNDFFPRLIDVMKTVDFQGKATVSEAKTAAADAMMKSGLFESPHGIHFITMHIHKRGDKIGWMYNLDALMQHFLDIASFPEDLKTKQYQGPVLFIGGTRSNYLPHQDLEGIRKLFPKAELKYVEGVGHNVHAENPTAFFNLAKEFLTAVK